MVPEPDPGPSEVSWNLVVIAVIILELYVISVLDLIILGMIFVV